ncbi:armadillo-type protein [Mucor mucedo]|uniref:armadillo-type protein n=1 Tax=Mucor mucedo TaxID=29922 RepID=UPI0022206FE2|nr:armadillo-type protein [Mucor mucedo]KAI7896890.1 armadillo-type protein [Mucor mucedo]
MSRLQTYFSSEFIASGQGTEFHEFITRITQAKSKSEETSHVTEELSKLTRSMGSPDISSTRMRDYLTRLIHCYMLGYSVDFSIIYAIMASQSGESVMDKRVGYLACTLFLQRNNELGIMLINTLQRDLKSQNYLDVCAALNAMCYLQHPEMLDSLLDLVIATMTFPKQVVRKKAVMALYFLYTRCTIDRLEAPLRQALEDKDFSVVFAALSVWKLILVDHAEQFGDLLPVVFRIHRQLIEKRIHKSFVYHGVYAPWAHMDCLAIYSIYLQLNIGSPKEVYDIVMECVHAMEKKVDAAFAVVLECIKLLSDMDPILLSCYSSDESPFVVLEPFLNASNLNLKYLGLIGMSYVDVSLWRPRWLDGSLIGDTVASAPFDETIVTQAMENLDMVMHREILMNTSPALIDACAQSTKLAYWLLNRLNEHVDRNAWYIETVMQIMAVTEKRLDDDYVETQCSLLKEALLGEIQETTKRECSVKVAYDLLKNTHGDTIPPLLLQFAFWTLGEHGYLSSLSSDIDRMTQLIKWLRLLHDDDLQTCALQAIKRCILRSKTWLSGLEPILKEYKKSPVPEKQQVKESEKPIIH